MLKDLHEDLDLHEGLVPQAEVDPLALLGIERHLDVGLALRAQRSSASQLAKSIASILSETPDVPVRLAGICVQHGFVEFTLAVSMGTFDQIKSGDGTALASLHLMDRMVTDLSAYEPALTQIPDPESFEASTARVATSAAMEGSLETAAGSAVEPARLAGLHALVHLV